MTTHLYGDLQKVVHRFRFKRRPCQFDIKQRCSLQRLRQFAQEAPKIVECAFASDLKRNIMDLCLVKRRHVGRLSQFVHGSFRCSRSRHEDFALRVRCIAMECWTDPSCILLLHEESRQAHRYPIARYGGWYAHTDVLGLRK